MNSGVGAEALMQLKPVITTGGADYAAATVQVRNEEQLFLALNNLPEHPITPNMVKKFLWIYSKEHQVHCDDVQSIENRISSLLPK